jgi:hypothetical protein
MTATIPRLAILLTACALAGLAPAAATGPPPETLLDLGDRRPAPKSLPGAHFAPQTTVEEGLVCTTIDFEGVGNRSPIPEFDGISSPDWLGIIDLDAGGTGNFAFEPSPETVAFWLGGETGTGSSRDIVLAEPAGTMEFFYASFVTVRADAFDGSGQRIATVSRPPNFDQGPGGDPTGRYNRWDLLRLQVDGNRIARVRVFGAVNQTGIDNLKVCRRIGVDTVELTQAIQELQDLDELLADLAGDGEPPVPMVQDKPGVLRVYFLEVQAVARVEVEVEVDGRRETRTVVLQPGCSRADQRLHRNGCRSADFDFTPSSGDVTIDLTLRIPGGAEIESHRFELEPRRAEPIVLGAVRVCDARDASGAWLCAENYRTRLGQLVALLRKIAPTASVGVVDTGETVRREIDANGDGNVTTGRVSEESAWWDGVVAEIDSLHGLFDGLRDFFGLEDRRYYGMARPGLAGGILGVAADIPSHGAVSRTQASDLGRDVSQDTVAHETFHTMNRKHTNTAVPSRSTAPGCHLAPDSTTDWPYPDNRIRSGNRASNTLEVGYDVARHLPLDPQNTFDIMSYCVPVWVSTFTYNRLLLEALRRSVPVEEQVAKGAQGSFWLVSGSLQGDAATLEPVIQLDTAGPTGEGSGSHRIEVRNASGAALFTRRFDPATTHARVAGDAPEPQVDPRFSELIPVQAGAASIAVLGPGGALLLSEPLAGGPPVVTVTFPQGGESLGGVQEVRWQIVDPDSPSHSSLVQYSPDNGALGTWRTLGRVGGDRLSVDFDDLPGTATASRIRVVASDGVNSGTAMSGAFTVARKSPSVTYVFPDPGAVFAGSETIWLQGAGFDPEDGAIEDLSWRSSLDGSLGIGSSLPVAGLSPGLHSVTVTARDSDGNAATRTEQVLVAGAAPTLELETEALDILPTTCVEITVDARAGSVPLETVEFSLDGGASWVGIPPSALPFRTLAPGSGFFHLVARAFDVAGQVDAADTRFFTDAPCESVAPPPPPGPWLTTTELPGFRFKARVTAGGTSTAGSSEADCLGETLCVSGNLPGRSELFARIIGPRPNGRLWVNLVRFTPSEVELWIEQQGTGLVNFYRLDAVPRESPVLTGLVDKQAFFPPAGGNAARVESAPRARRLGDAGVEAFRLMPAGTLVPAAVTPDVEAAVFTSPEFPGFEFRVRIFAGGEEQATRQEADCLAETVCASGALPGRSELFLRLIGPRPNGFLWVNLVRFTTSRVEVEIKQLGTGVTKTYVLPEIPRESDALDGQVDKEAFEP